MTLFEDEVLFPLGGTIARTWGPVGGRVNILSQPGRSKVGAFGAVSVDHDSPKFHFRFEAGHFNTKTFLTFVRQLIRYYRGRKIHLIVDGVPYHKSAMKWSREHSDQIQIHILPPASPKLNPTETVWRITKKTATHNRFFPAPTLLKMTIRRRFNRYQGNPASLRGVVKEW